MSDSEQTRTMPSWLQTLSKRAGLIAALGGVFLVGLIIGTCGGGAPSTAPELAQELEDYEGEWTCPMHPEVRSKEPGRCPKCGMELVPVGEVGDEDPRRVSLSPRSRLLAKIHTEEVSVAPRGPLELRLLGEIDYDETRLRTVTSWVDGRIDRLVVAATGERVRAGQRIATLYSPEVYTAHSDLIQAIRYAARLEGASDSARAAAEAALSSARRRLELLGVPKSEVRRMEAAEAPWQHISIYSPFAGTVIERLVDQGNYVVAGSGIYRIADLSRVWIQLDAYESDLPNLSEGQMVEISVEALPGKTFHGTVAFIDPVIDPRTRTVKVRVEAKNPARLLRPGMFAEATVKADGREEPMLAIPDTAPLFTGRRSVVFVEVPDAERPTYEIREVTLGPKRANRYPVISGLSAGERVVVRGAFVLDADLQLRAGQSMMSRPDDRARAANGPIDNVPAEVMAALASVLEAYLNIQEALARDDLPAAERAASVLVAALPAVDSAVEGEVREVWHPVAEDLRRHAMHIEGAGSLERARHGFESLTEAILIVLRRFGNPLDEPVQLAFCPMAFDSKGGRWIQRLGEIDNVYFGKSMDTCGSFEARVEPGASLDLGDTAPQSAPAGGHQH